jgi:hypothetical protein
MKTLFLSCFLKQFMDNLNPYKARFKYGNECGQKSTDIGDPILKSQLHPDMKYYKHHCIYL